MSVAAKNQEVTRSLKTLEGLIKEKLKEADQAAEAARQRYYEEIGPLLVEARDSHFIELSQFYAWALKKFGISQGTTRRYTQYVDASLSKSFKHLTHFTHTPKAQGGLGHTPRIKDIRRDWAAPVDDIAERARREAFRLAQEDALTRAQEREAERKLALRLIDIGYKVLAKELHPDKLHGDRDAMARLNRVKEKLRHCI